MDDDSHGFIIDPLVVVGVVVVVVAVVVVVDPYHPWLFLDLHGETRTSPSINAKGGGGGSGGNGGGRARRRFLPPRLDGENGGH